MPHSERLNIAVFIDFDNIEIGVKSTLGEHFDVGIILDAIKERGEVVTKIAYADWTRASEYSRSLTQHAIRLVQRNLTPGGDKNGADINLALDALEMAFTHPHINAYVIVGGDSDFLSLVEKLKQYDKKVFVVGGRAFTSIILQRNCHEFIAYENLTSGRRAPAKGGRPAVAPASSPIAQAFPIVRRALKILADREVSPQTGLLKSTLLQLDSTFSERTYGTSSFLDFVEKLAQTGLVQLKHAGRSVMVELNGGFVETPEETTGRPAPVEPPYRAHAPRHEAVRQESDGGEQPPSPSPASAPETSPEQEAEGVLTVGRILTAATTARWPMYVRNVKQILRAADGGFDERRFGCGGLIDLLRACQREGLLRLERDRRGGLRVFPGAALQRPASAPDMPVPPQSEQVDVAPGETFQPDERFLPVEASESDEAPAEPQPLIDPTAELLGTAKPKRPRARTAGVVTRRATPLKAAPARRATRGRKPPTSTAKDEGDFS